MSVILPRLSLEYLLFPLDVSPTDPATLDHEVAVVDELVYPETADWQTATYVGDEVQVLVRGSTDAEPVPPGSTAHELTPGRWRVWWRAASNPEYPVRQVGVVHVV